VISRLDITTAAGGANRALTKRIQNIATRGTLSVELIPVLGDPPLICSLEALRQ
jgi:hypothetical protein